METEALLIRPDDATKESDNKQHVHAILIMALIIIGILAANEFDADLLMVIPILVAFTITAKLSPPVTALSYISGMPLFGLVELKAISIGFIGIPRLPFLTILGAWVVITLIYWQVKEGTIDRLYNPKVVKLICIFGLFLFIGLFVSAMGGGFSDPTIRQHIFDILRYAIGGILFGMLACRNYKDLDALFLYLPFSILIMLVSIPLNIWMQYFKTGNFTTSIYVGFGYGSLNVNTLGHVAAVASIVAALIIVFKKDKKIQITYGLILIIAVLVVYFTASRQALISMMLGLVLIGFTLSFKRRLISWIAVFSIIIALGVLFFIQSGEGSGFQKRFLELGKPAAEWETGSYTLRMEDIEEGLAIFQENPVFGVGFGNMGTRIRDVDESSGAAVTRIYTGHSIFVNILGETGIVGFLLFIVLTASIIREYLKSLNSVDLAENKQFYKVTIIVILIAMLLQLNISGAIGASSSLLFFLYGAMMSISAYSINSNKMIRRP